MMRRAVVIATMLVGFIGPMTSRAADQTATHVQTIVVKGNASVQRPPDWLNVAFTVQSESDDPRKAQEANTPITNAVLERLKALDLGEKAVRLVRVSVYADFEDVQKGDRFEQRLRAHVAQSRIEVQTSKVDIAARIINDAFEAGVTGLDTVYFSLVDPTSARTDALTKAVRMAKADAEATANAADLSLGSIRRVQVDDARIWSDDQGGGSVYGGDAGNYNFRVAKANTELLHLEPVPVNVYVTVTIEYALGAR